MCRIFCPDSVLARSVWYRRQSKWDGPSDCTKSLLRGCTEIGYMRSVISTAALYYGGLNAHGGLIYVRGLVYGHQLYGGWFMKCA